MATSNRLRNLEEQLSREKDSSERREILACVLAQIQMGWDELFEWIATEQSPERVLPLLAELDEVLESRKAQLSGRGVSPGSASDSGSIGEGSAETRGSYAQAGMREGSRLYQAWLRSA